MGPMGSQSSPFPCTPLLHTSAMGFNDTGTLGVAGRAPKTRESRRRRRQGRWGLRRGCAPSQKIYEFSSQNGVIWCILGVLFLRFMCPTDCSCMINFTEVPVCARSSAEGKNKTLVKILGGRQHRTTPAGQILGGGSRPLQLDAYDVSWRRGTARILLSAGRAAISRYLLSAGPTAANPQQRRVAAGWDRQIDRQRDRQKDVGGELGLHTPSSEYYAGSDIIKKSMNQSMNQSINQLISLFI